MNLSIDNLHAHAKEVDIPIRFFNMRISVRKISFCSVISILALIILVRANSGSAVNVPGQAPSVPTFAGNAQHTAVYQTAAQNLNSIHWSTTIDLNNSGALAHYGAPLITSANTVLVPVKTVGDGFQVNAFDGSSGDTNETKSNSGSSSLLNTWD
jgi:hypothetical protein